MRLTDASVAIRPRSPWEALDLGILLSRRHAGILMASWALVSLPVFVLLSALLWNHSSWAILLFWWLKPAFERLPLYILSRALFNDAPTLKQALRAFPGLLRNQLLPSLLWRRFSPTRSFDLPVLQLEELKGQARSQRLVVLGQRNAGGAGWLTVVGLLFELALWLGLSALLYLLLPQQWVSDWKWQSLVSIAQTEWVWVEHLSNLLYALLLIVWEPVYVACGFTLYLNRRTELEAWDVELVFRRLRQRLIGSAYALLLVIAACLAPLPGTSAWAATASQSCPLPDQNPDGPQAPRLLNQALTSDQSRHEVDAILGAPPFRNSNTVTRWRLTDPKEAKSKPQNSSQDQSLKEFFDALEHWQVFKSLAQIIEVLLWGTLLSVIVLLVWRYRQWLVLFAGRIGLPQSPRREVPSVLFGLELAPQSLPDDVASEAERLWDEQPRAALGLLYRALLSRLLHDFRMPLRDSTTEGEVLAQVDDLDNPPLARFAHALTLQWQALAYGHRPPQEGLKQRLCGEWRNLFGNEVRA
ncbi:DUF4129 domain-containing protein [Pseudomonas sp. ZM23]|uniref:DUF4129 domain-containing protein n=1 Tax=Pseudomonas triclosanedens TaxID=2961893 RepID=A0ABY6ZUK9_9PSED|nr:DUF4129 domain-containing protein [Pseudomonas triclosanedens]MCP8463158.1 DUF4129 domain-containing protein [Pseudomonas triclosanedens]MCP8469783.1 DUF4129 domain-containing protein [Pseudomonas triclosanedens]MCP8473959.1 DUF4129 domain-containing protein [Pseudomonas triclosanedens]WAI48642.1 DUF4129 domain-containing protein [Pseudomonas triclosanedens]